MKRLPGTALYADRTHNWHRGPRWPRYGRSSASQRLWMSTRATYLRVITGMADEADVVRIGGETVANALYRLHNRV